MRTKTYIRYGNQLISLDEADSWQRKFCDRIVMDKDYNVVREITSDSLRQIDAESWKIPGTPMLVGQIVPILQQIRAKESISNILDDLN